MPDVERSIQLGEINGPCAYPQVRHRIQLQERVDAIREGRDLVLTGEEPRVSLAMNMPIYESSRTAREVSLSDFTPRSRSRAPG